MTETFPSPARSWWRPGVRFVFRTGRRTAADSLYLLTAPVIAAGGLLVAAAGLCAATAGSLLHGGRPSAVAAAVLRPARWFADLERWRIARVRPQEPSPRTDDPPLWLDVAHALVIFPVTLVTAIITGLWWFFALAAGTVGLRNPYIVGTLRPQNFYLGSARFHLTLSLGLTTPASRIVFGTTLGLVMLLTLPLATRACVAVQAGLGQLLLSLHRRIRGLEQERDTARAQTAAAVAAEAAALRRLERDIHDGPQQRLVRLAMELGRAQRHLDSKPEIVRGALADAIAQTQEALDELRALSRGIAPPILADRGLREALTALAERSTVPAELDASDVTQRLDPGTETAAYFVIAEALTNVAKHSQASRCVIGVRQSAGSLRAWVTDDGIGGAALDKGHGLRGLDDRVRAAGGVLRVTSPGGGPTTITAELPCR